MLYIMCMWNFRERKLIEINVFSLENIFSLESFTSVLSGISNGKNDWLIPNHEFHLTLSLVSHVPWIHPEVLVVCVCHGKEQSSNNLKGASLNLYIKMLEPPHILTSQAIIFLPSEWQKLSFWGCWPDSL